VKVKQDLNTAGKVIVLGASYGALGVIKALVKEGVPVILMFSDPHDHACQSRFITRRVQIPNPMDDSSGLLDILMKPGNGLEGALLIPTLDEYVIFISQNRDELKKKFVFTVQDWETTRRIINKNGLYPQAKSVGVPTPQFFFPDSVESLYENRDKFLYPCILKPFETHKFDRIYKRKVLIVHNFDELVERYADTLENNMGVMISEIIPGADNTLFHYRSYIDSQGTLLAEMCTQKIRQYPPGFGQAAVARTIPLIPQVRDQALKLLRSLSYRGESSTEFKLDKRDNQYKLMEINVRPVLPEWHFATAGISFPYITYLDLIENVRKPSLTYRQELYWIHNYWDTVNFIESLRSGTLNLKEFIQPYLKKKVFVVPFMDDPIHYFSETFFNTKKVLTRKPPPRL